MLRKIVFVLIALALPLAAAQAASADQYPPTGDGSTTVPAPHEGEPAARPEPAPLARTGSEVTVLAGVALVLLAGGAVVVVASRRRTGVPAA